VRSESLHREKNETARFSRQGIRAKVYTHDLDDLLGIAGLKGQLQQRFHQDPALEAKWGIVKDWSEQARYEMAGPQRESLRRPREMLNAVADRQGILACIQQYW
jgi:hypothetical protein